MGPILERETLYFAFIFAGSLRSRECLHEQMLEILLPLCRKTG